MELRKVLVLFIEPFSLERKVLRNPQGLRQRGTGQSPTRIQGGLLWGGLLAMKRGGGGKGIPSSTLTTGKGKLYHLGGPGIGEDIWLRKSEKGRTLFKITNGGSCRIGIEGRGKRKLPNRGVNGAASGNFSLYFSLLRGAEEGRESEEQKGERTLEILGSARKGNSVC